MIIAYTKNVDNKIGTDIIIAFVLDLIRVVELVFRESEELRLSVVSIVHTMGSIWKILFDSKQYPSSEAVLDIDSFTNSHVIVMRKLYSGSLIGFNLK